MPACAYIQTHTHTRTQYHTAYRCVRLRRACERVRANECACSTWLPLPVDALIMLHHTAYPAPRSLASTVAKVRPSSIVVKPRTFSNKNAFGCVSVMIRTRWKNRSPVPFSPRPLRPRTRRYIARNTCEETKGGAFSKRGHQLRIRMCYNEAFIDILKNIFMFKAYYVFVCACVCVCVLCAFENARVHENMVENMECAFKFQL